MSDDKTKRGLAKARHSAKAFGESGEGILRLVEANKRLLTQGADEGVPPVSKIGAVLKAEYESEMKLLPVRQWVGSLVRAILAVEGYEVDQAGIRFTDPVFKSGSTYRRISEPNELDPALDSFLRRLVKVMTPSEKAALQRVLAATV